MVVIGIVCLLICCRANSPYLTLNSTAVFMHVKRSEKKNQKKLKNFQNFSYRLDGDGFFELN
jgi:hypothetical protein